MGDGAVGAVVGIGLLVCLGLVWDIATRAAALRRARMSSLVRQAVVVETTDAQTIKGVLVGEYDDALVLQHASYVGNEGDLQMPGEVWVPRAKVSFVHRPEALTPTGT